MTEDQNRGPIYNVQLPEELAIRNGWTQVVPRRDELKLVREKVGDRTVAALEVALETIKVLSSDLLKIHAENGSAIDALVKRSGFVLTQCPRCGEFVISIPDRPAICKPTCVPKAGGL
jgi:hypothetical protein